MKYEIKANEVNSINQIRGFAMVVLGDVFKITNIAIVESSEQEQLFVSMPRYKTSEQDEKGPVYKDICNPITKEYREELYGSILKAFEDAANQGKEQNYSMGKDTGMPEFSVTVKVFTREGSNIRGLARIYFEGSFVVNNVSILQGKEGVFVAMPSYKTNQKDEQGKAVYRDVCYPVTKEFREKLFGEIFKTYEKVMEEKMQEKVDSEKKQGKGKCSSSAGRPGRK